MPTLLGDRILAVALGLVGLALLLLALDMTTSHTYDPLGPAFFVRVTGAVLAVCSVVLFLRPSPPAAHHDDSSQQSAGRLRNVLFMMAACIAYVLMLPLMGYLASTTITSLGILYFFGTRRWTTLLLLPTTTTIVVYAVFDRLLGIRLP